MIYKEFQGLKLSQLGMGTMRLPVLEGDNAPIDEAAAAEMVAYAMEQGVNYFDTAWGYHKGQSETVMGKILSRYPRESFYLASKFPGYDVENLKNHKAVFEKQLEKCQVDYFDFYLFHSVTGENIDLYLDEQYGLLDFILEEKRKGRIRHLGFSCHGDLPVLKRFLDTWGDHLEFCQLQVNYIDWTFQQAKEKVELVRSYGLPVWIMEPLRGGTLATLREEDSAALKTFRPNVTHPGWAFRFLQSIPGVTMILSGMSNMEQLKDNIGIFSTEASLNKPEMTGLLAVAQNILKRVTVPCTTCRYCMEYCPQGLNIPALLAQFNDHAFSGKETIWPEDVADLPPEKRPTACIACRRCEGVCPQGIKISEIMARFRE